MESEQEQQGENYFMESEREKEIFKKILKGKCHFRPQNHKIK